MGICRVLDAPLGGIYLQTPYDGEFVYQLKRLPQGLRSWLPDRKVWWVSSVVAEQAIAMAATYFDVEDERSEVSRKAAEAAEKERQRKQQEEAFRQRQAHQQQQQERTQQQRSQQSSPPPPPRNPTHLVSISDAYAVLCVADNAPEEVCRAAYKALAKKHHPDLGGNSETMKTINQAFQMLENLWK